ncbi:hypothetical protein AMTR_s00035p00164410 [Amborella trichopoda]|uniref:Aminotransferase-like plant mobile domain-containing protein n=1 Tax=Amborella trichopoda TaxID=13333 RepID=W1PWC5_AMBTC|nr:hypothetical protein AMTR_s00035p00164410 [Amborella trichopoda]
MTAALFDAYETLRLVMDGDPVTCHPISDLQEFIEDNLGEVPTRGNLAVIKHSWLKAKFHQLPPDATPVQVLKYTRAYLLFLISVTIFSDSLQVIWNPYFKPNDVISYDRRKAFETTMCITTLIFDDIAEPYMPERVCR